MVGGKQRLRRAALKKREVCCEKGELVGYTSGTGLVGVLEGQGNWGPGRGGAKRVKVMVQEGEKAGVTAVCVALCDFAPPAESFLIAQRREIFSPTSARKTQAL